MVHDLHSKIGQSAKLKSSYKSPYVVKRALNNNRDVVQDISCSSITPNKLLITQFFFLIN